MMKPFKMLMVPLFAYAFFACSGNSQNGDTQEQTEQTEQVGQSVSSLSECSRTGTHTIGGTRYDYSFRIACDTSLAIVTNPQDYQYYDNKATLVVKSGNTEIINRTFTKNAFKEYVSEEVFNHSALIGFAYNEDESQDRQAIHFIATIGDPDLTAESFKSFDLRFTSSGSMTIEELENENMELSGTTSIDPAREDNEMDM